MTKQKYLARPNFNEEGAFNRAPDAILTRLDQEPRTKNQGPCKFVSTNGQFERREGPLVLAQGGCMPPKAFGELGRNMWGEGSPPVKHV